jgi:hypothetical protein
MYVCVCIYIGRVCSTNGGNDINETFVTKPQVTGPLVSPKHK